MEWETPVWWGRFLLFCVPQSVKTKETNPTRPGSPTLCKQALRVLWTLHRCSKGRFLYDSSRCGNVNQVELKEPLELVVLWLGNLFFSEKC